MCNPIQKQKSGRTQDGSSQRLHVRRCPMRPVFAPVILVLLQFTRTCCRLRVSVAGRCCSDGRWAWAGRRSRQLRNPTQRRRNGNAADEGSQWLQVRRRPMILFCARVKLMLFQFARSGCFMLASSAGRRCARDCWAHWRAPPPVCVQLKSEAKSGMQMTWRRRQLHVWRCPER